jgi:hypothetical protein
LNVSLSIRYSINSTIELLVISQLLIEQWVISLSYEIFFIQYGSISCLYSYEEYTRFIDTALHLIGLYSGLVIIFNVVMSMLLVLCQFIGRWI